MANRTAFALNDQAERASRALPPLLVEAERIAATVILGIHGRRRAGPGESFWQYRPYSFGDSTARVDWHKSARSDRVFIRENEWEAANTLWLWASSAPGMEFRSDLATTTKRERADLIVLALASLALRAHERVGLIGSPDGPGHSRAILLGLARRLIAGDGMALPRFERPPRHASAVLVGDFLEPAEEIASALTPMAEAGIAGHLVQVMDPAEETLPWTGRTEFKAVTGPLRALAGKAENLRQPYGERLARHRGELRDLCSGLGWTFNLHRTDMAPAAALLHLHQLIAGNRDRRAGGFIR